jgi:hypothetical protein
MHRRPGAVRSVPVTTKSPHPNIPPHTTSFAKQCSNGRLLHRNDIFYVILIAERTKSKLHGSLPFNSNSWQSRSGHFDNGLAGSHEPTSGAASPSQITEQNVSEDSDDSTGSARRNEVDESSTSPENAPLGRGMRQKFSTVPPSPAMQSEQPYRQHDSDSASMSSSVSRSRSSKHVANGHDPSYARGHTAAHSTERAVASATGSKSLKRGRGRPKTDTYKADQLEIKRLTDDLAKTRMRLFAANNVVDELRVHLVTGKSQQKPAIAATGAAATALGQTSQARLAGTSAAKPVSVVPAATQPSANKQTAALHHELQQLRAQLDQYHQVIADQQYCFQCIDFAVRTTPGLNYQLPQQVVQGIAYYAWQGNPPPESAVVQLGAAVSHPQFYQPQHGVPTHIPALLPMQQQVPQVAMPMQQQIGMPMQLAGMQLQHQVPQTAMSVHQSMTQNGMPMQPAAAQVQQPMQHASTTMQPAGMPMQQQHMQQAGMPMQQQHMQQAGMPMQQQHMQQVGMPMQHPGMPTQQIGLPMQQPAAQMTAKTQQQYHLGTQVTSMQAHQSFQAAQQQTEPHVAQSSGQSAATVPG